MRMGARFDLQKLQVWGFEQSVFKRNFALRLSQSRCNMEDAKKLLQNFDFVNPLPDEFLAPIAFMFIIPCLCLIFKGYLGSALTYLYADCLLWSIHQVYLQKQQLHGVLKKPACPASSRCLFPNDWTSVVLTLHIFICCMAISGLFNVSRGNGKSSVSASDPDVDIDIVDS